MPDRLEVGVGMELGRKIARRTIAAAVACGLLAALPLQAGAADEQYCRHLKAQLASASASRSDVAMLDRYERAIEDQTNELSRAHRIARSSGCTGFFGNLRDDPSGRCDPIRQTIDRMERNMSKLRQRKDVLAARADRPGRQEILAAIDASGCGGQQVAARRLPGPVGAGSDGRDLFNRINPGVVIHRSGPPQEGDVPAVTPDDGYADPSGTYRTMCVRTCDGYYFPISFATSPANFARDEQTCQARCPGTKVELYYHVPDQESADMVSLAGVPYKDLPTAFLYRKADAPRIPGCTCMVAGRTSVIAATPGNDAAPEEKAPVSQALPRPERATGDKPKAANPAAEAAAAGPTPEADKNRKVRVVGPTFLPDPSKAIDLQAPARKKAP
jgi:hypothetical protein